MFCSECGVKASGKFCFNCGNPLQAAMASLSPLPAGFDWENDARYENIVRVEAVRAVIAGHAAGATKGLSGEALLAIYDKIVSSPVSFEGIASVVQPLYAKWGVRTGKDRTETIDAPIGRAIARALCSLASKGQAIQGVEQGEDGCLLTAELPSSVTSFQGELKISLQRAGDGTHVAAATHIPGQVYDWGKSNRSLDRLFADLRQDQGLPASNKRQAA